MLVGLSIIIAAAGPRDFLIGIFTAESEPKKLNKKVPKWRGPKLLHLHSNKKCNIYALIYPSIQPKKMHGICHGNAYIIYACIASDMQPAVLKTTNTYQDMRVMWNLYSFYNVLMEKYVPLDLNIFFSRTVFQFQWQKTQVCLCSFRCFPSNSVNVIDVSSQVDVGRSSG